MFTLIFCDLIRQLYVSKYTKWHINRFWNILGEKKVSAVWKPNEDFCHIIVDDGMFDHHLPDYVTNAVDRLFNQHVAGNDKSLRRASEQTDSHQPEATTITEQPKEKVVDTELDTQNKQRVETVLSYWSSASGSSKRQAENTPTNGHTVVVVHESETQYTETSV